MSSLAANLLAFGRLLRTARTRRVAGQSRDALTARGRGGVAARGDVYHALCGPRW